MHVTERSVCNHTWVGWWPVWLFWTIVHWCFTPSVASIHIRDDTDTEVVNWIHLSTSGDHVKLPGLRFTCQHFEKHVSWIKGIKNKESGSYTVAGASLVFITNWQMCTTQWSPLLIYIVSGIQQWRDCNKNRSTEHHGRVHCKACVWKVPTLPYQNSGFVLAGCYHCGGFKSLHPLLSAIVWSSDILFLAHYKVPAIATLPASAPACWKRSHLMIQTSRWSWNQLWQEAWGPKVKQCLCLHSCGLVHLRSFLHPRLKCMWVTERRNSRGWLMVGFRRWQS